MVAQPDRWGFVRGIRFPQHNILKRQLDLPRRVMREESSRSICEERRVTVAAILKATASLDAT